MSQKEGLHSGAPEFQSVILTRKVSFFVKFSFSVVMLEFVFCSTASDIDPGTTLGSGPTEPVAGE